MECRMKASGAGLVPLPSQSLPRAPAQPCPPPPAPTPLTGSARSTRRLRLRLFPPVPDSPSGSSARLCSGSGRSATSCQVRRPVGNRLRLTPLERAGRGVADCGVRVTRRTALGAPDFGARDRDAAVLGLLGLGVSASGVQSGEASRRPGPSSAASSGASSAASSGASSPSSSGASSPPSSAAGGSQTSSTGSAGAASVRSAGVASAGGWRTERRAVG